MIFLVTGGSGYIGSSCVRELLNQGHTVIATCRSQEKANLISSFWHKKNLNIDNLNWEIIDLKQTVGWHEIIKQCDFILHLASPVLTDPKIPLSEIVQPAIIGLNNIFMATKGTNVRKIVLTSSSTTINCMDNVKNFNHESWSNLADPNIGAYAFSKTYTEMLAWNLKALNPWLPELTSILPAFVIGAPACPNPNSFSINIIKKIMSGTLPKSMYNCKFHFISLTDTTKIHIAAATNNISNSKRYLCSTAKPISLKQIKIWLDEAGLTKNCFNWRYTPLPKKYYKYLASDVLFDCSETYKDFNWQPSSIKQEIIEMALTLDIFD